MFDITPIAITGIFCVTIYKFTELLVRKRERLQIIDKISEISSTGITDIEKLFGTKINISARFSALRYGSVLAGFGIGLLIAFAICQLAFGYQIVNDDVTRYIGNVMSVIYGGSTFLFGGLGLLVCYMIERKESERK